MPESIDWPRINPPRRRRRFLLILAVFAGILFGGRTALSYYVDVLWFGSLGYGDVFWKTLSLQWGRLRGVCRGHISHSVRIVSGSEAGTPPRFAERSHDFHRRQQPVKLPVEPVLRLIALVVSLAIAAVTGAGMMAEWPTLALYWYAPRSQVALSIRSSASR